MSINHNVDLNLSASVMPPVLNMAQYDANSRTIVATLWDGTSGFNVPSGAVVMVRFGKPDNTGGLYDHTEAGEAITYSGNVVTAPVATQMLSVSGKVQADIEIYQSGATEQASVKLATFCFTVNVEKAAYPDAEIISSDYYNIISADISEFRTAQEQIIKSQAELETVAESITGNISSAQQAAQTATEKAASAATSSENAESSKTAAETAKTAAESAKTDAEAAKNASESAKTDAENSKTAAELAKTAAESAKTYAETAKDNAEAAAAEAQNFATAMQECAPYDNAKSYVVANMVTSGGSTYRCIKPCTGISPPNSTYWLVIAQKGADGMVQKSSIVTATLLSTGWTGDAAPYSYALTVSGVTATSNQEVLPALNITVEQLEALQSANIQDGGRAANTMTLKAYGDKPTIDLPIRVIKRGD